MKLLPLLLGCAICAAPLAHADQNDDAYLYGLNSVGVPPGSPAAAAAYGRSMCDRLPAVGFDPLVAAVNQENAASGLTMHQSALVIGSAIANYCLDKSSFLPHDLKY